MPNATNIVLRRDDGTDLTLVPVSSLAQNGVMTITFRELSATKPEMACVRVTITAEKMKSGVMKITRKLEVPVMAIIPANAVNADGRTAAPQVDHVETDIRVRFHSPYSNATERADSLRLANHLDIGATSSAGSFINPAQATAFVYRDGAAANQLPYGDVNYVWPSA